MSHGCVELTWGGSGDIASLWAAPTMSSSGANFCGRNFGSTTCIFFCKEVENLVKALLLCHGGESPEAISLLHGRLGVLGVVDNHTINDSLAAHGWGVTKKAQHGQGPISVHRYVHRTRRRLLTDMQPLQTLERRFRCCKKRK